MTRRFKSSSQSKTNYLSLSFYLSISLSKCLFSLPLLFLIYSSFFTSLTLSVTSFLTKKLNHQRFCATKSKANYLFLSFYKSFFSLFLSQIYVYPLSLPLFLIPLSLLSHSLCDIISGKEIKVIKDFALPRVRPTIFLFHTPSL